MITLPVRGNSATRNSENKIRIKKEILIPTPLDIKLDFGKVKRFEDRSPVQITL